MEAIKQAIIEMLNSATEEELKIIYLFAAQRTPCTSFFP